MGRFKRLSIMATRALGWEREAIAANDFETAIIFANRWYSLWLAMYRDTMDGLSN